MKRHNELRLQYCKRCPIKDCGSCAIGREIEELTKKKIENRELEHAEALSKVLQLKEAMIAEATKIGVELIDAGYLTIKYNNKTHIISCNERPKDYI